ncbi:MAG: hypothetical protein R2810_00755 [Flavobacteriales bacterium]
MSLLRQRSCRSSKLEGERLAGVRLPRWAIARTIIVYGTAPGLSRSNVVLWPSRR